MTLTELTNRLGLKSPDSLRMQIKKGVLKAEKIGAGAHAIWVIEDGEAERYEREHHGKRGFAAETHPFHGKRPPRHGEE